MPTLWRRMIKGASHTLQTIGFRFFRDLVAIVLDCNTFDSNFYKAHRTFFNGEITFSLESRPPSDCVLTFPAENLTQSGFKCFSMYLKFVNISKGILEYTPSMDLEDDEQKSVLRDSDFEVLTFASPLYSFAGRGIFVSGYYVRSRCPTEGRLKSARTDVLLI